jgi:hypothetical protein
MAERAAATAAALAELDPASRAALAGYQPGTYVRLRFTGGLGGERGRGGGGGRREGLGREEGPGIGGREWEQQRGGKVGEGQAAARSGLPTYLGYIPSHMQTYCCPCPSSPFLLPFPVHSLTPPHGRAFSP